HDAGQSERDAIRVFPGISERNYIGLSLRGTKPINTVQYAFGWARAVRARRAFVDGLHTAVCGLRQQRHINSERIFLIGAGHGGSVAWEIFLAHPEWFAGAAVLDGKFPWRNRPLRQYRQLQGKAAFLAGPEKAEQDRTASLLHAAGLEVVRCACTS